MSIEDKQLNILHKISNTLEELKSVSEKTLGQTENQNHNINDMKNMPNEMMVELPKEVVIKGGALIKDFKGEKGDPGQDGKSIKGDRGDPGQDGKDGVDGKEGKKGPKGEKGDIGKGKDGKDGVDGKDGQDGSTDTPIEIRDKLQLLEGEQRLDASAIKNLPMGGNSYNERRGGGKIGPGTINQIAYFDSPTTITSLPIATYPSLTELSYVKGVTSTIQTQINAKLSSATAATTYLPLAGGTLTGNLLFTDNTLDIGASGATRPRTGYFGTSVVSPILIGGTATTSTLILQSTSGVGTSASLIKFLTGNAGGTENARMETLSVDGGDGTGGTISHSGGNTIHKFLLADSGTSFTPPAGVTSVTYLVVAGGGGGATSAGYGGGGGAGGLLASTQAVTPGTPYTITVGDGGTPGNNGGNSSIAASVVSLGGGKGGAAANGSDGGSGGGGATSYLGGAGTAGQGNNGADAVNNGGYSAGGGGGGASHVGYLGVATPAGHGGNGGEGTSSSISGSAVTYAGGGGGSQFVTGGTGGPGGGGAGGKFGVNGTAGTDNTGGGGGAGGASSTMGGKGGSGIVYISYVPAQTSSPASGIKQTSPTALLHLGAGTALASTAPLKFTSGTNLTTAEAGAMEFDGTNLYFTPSTVRNTILIGSSSALVYKITGTSVRATTEGTNHLDIFNGTAPVGTLANGFSLYSASGLAYAMDSAGVRTAISTAHTIFTPVTTASITLINNQNNLVDPAGTIAELTIVFPASPANNDFVFVKFTQIVTAITYTAGTGGATIKSQVNGVVGGFEKWVYDSGTNTWY